MAGGPDLISYGNLISADCPQGQYPLIQLLEYETDVQRCRFDTLGKLTPAYCSGARVVGGPAAASDSPTAQGEPKLPIGGGSPRRVSDFPTDINLAHCSRLYIADSGALAT